MEQDIQTWVKLAAYAGGGLSIGLGAIGAAIGEGYTAAQANSAVSRNPALAGDVFKSMLVGQAIAESASIFSLVVAMILLFSNIPATSMVTVSAVFAAVYPWALVPSDPVWEPVFLRERPVLEWSGSRQ